jgi:hypothetical protein
MGDLEAVALALMEAARGSAMSGEGLGGVKVEEEAKEEEEEEEEEGEEEELAPKN